MPLTPERKLALLWDKHAVEELMLQFGRALDTRDFALYRSCFAEQIDVDFRELTGFTPALVCADLWTEFAERALAPWLTHHQYSNVSITVNDDRASGTIYMVARHARRDDTTRFNTQYGWYRNAFERCDEAPGWRITALGHHFQWLAGDPDLLDTADQRLATLIEKLFGGAAGRSE